MGSNVSHGLVAARRMVAPSPCGRFAVLLCTGPLPVSRVCCTSAGSTRDDLDVLRRGPPRPDVLALPEMAPHLQLPGGVGAEDLHRGTVVVAEPGRVAAAEERTGEPLVELDLGPGAQPTPYRRWWRSRRRADRRGEPEEHQCGRGGMPAAAARGSAAVSLPHAGEPKTAPSCSGINVAFPHQWWRAQHSSPIPGRMEPRSGAQCAAGFRAEGSERSYVMQYGPGQAQVQRC